MAQVTITINSREYAVACEDGQEVRILQLARMLDEKAKLLTEASGQVNENMLLAMVGLLLADELSELRKGNPAPTAVQSPSPAAFDKQLLLETDKLTAEALDKITKQINFVANQIESL